MFKDIKFTNLASARVLYVEDDTETREELQLMLEHFVAELYTAKNGREGLALYREHLPDIVVTDIQMPEMNGLSMAADIKTLNPEQAIVILSAYNDVEYLFRALELGISNYVTKPISVNRLLDKLAEITDQAKLARDGEQNRKLLDQYKLLVDEKAIVAKIDLNGAIVYVNQHFCALSGYAEAELLGQYYLFDVEKDQHVATLENLKTTILEKNKWQGLLKKITKAGCFYVVDMTIVAIMTAQNEIEEFVALMVDMSEVYEKFERLSLELKQDLSYQKHYLQEYEHAMEVGTSQCVFDLDGMIVSANQNFSATLNYSPKELIGQSFYKFILDYSDFKERVLKKVLDQGYSTRVIKVLGNNGFQRTLSTVIIGIHNEQGALHSLMSLSRDISDSISLTEEIIETQKELIYVLGDVVENRNRETGLHIKRVALISELLARKYGLSEEHSAMIKTASPLHDIGKIGIPDDILNSPGKLSEAEFTIMKTHADMGFKLLNRLDKPLIKMAATIAHEHHEYYNGNGYPAGLSGEHIAIEARIVSLVDVFDALGSKRVYKESWSDQDIFNYLNSNKSIQFDPELVDLFMKNIDEILEIRNQLRDE
jgi:PAS domain S-box-containing protein